MCNYCHYYYNYSYYYYNYYHYYRPETVSPTRCDVMRHFCK